jgi:hypothetical protein
MEHWHSSARKLTWRMLSMHRLDDKSAQTASQVGRAVWFGAKRSLRKAIAVAHGDATTSTNLPAQKCATAAIQARLAEDLLVTVIGAPHAA